MEDIKGLLASKPSKLIIGTGYSGMMSVDDEVIRYCEKHSIGLSINPTKKAADEFNISSSSAAAFHLTC